MSFSFGNLGSSTAQPERRTGTLFGATQAPAGGLFSQQPTSSAAGLFGSTTATAPQQQQSTGGLFGASQQPQQQQQQQNTGGLFNSMGQQQQQNAGQGMFGASQQQQQPQQPNLSNSLFGGKLLPQPSLSQAQQQALQQSQQGLPQLRQSSNAPFAHSQMSGSREKSIVEQMRVLGSKWEPSNQDCSFQFYFYNNVDPNNAPFYGPQAHEDEKKWEEALSKKPSPGSIPVLARGFEEVAARINMQKLAVSALQVRLHEINNSLQLMKNMHELDFASRISEAKRRHIVFTQRILALATKTQICRNRGYVMDQQEEELKKKLLELEKKTFDPVLGGRQEEIWARMSSVRERARILQEETERLGKTVEGQQEGQILSEEDQKALEKLLKDYDKQLEHLKKWVDDTKKEYDEYEQDKTKSSTRTAR
ncbi:nucleoporin complex subunit 54-domain-containing protein [Lophiotrema nucula]|uniref:Nucleoporin complex subunit 54-domain-containing protein n=1 Tax=Lophiotrema nucula TaxID=690887 RepID=A0A6A5ZKB0_9PLEO|nr:nucleoporin complex subunit 54-domain-containing protein [Lophiotrema nucula]